MNLPSTIDSEGRLLVEWETHLNFHTNFQSHLHNQAFGNLDEMPHKPRKAEPLTIATRNVKFPYLFLLPYDIIHFREKNRAKEDNVINGRGKQSGASWILG